MTLSTALTRGLAPDGGLYVPESLPPLRAEGESLAELAGALLRPFFEGDPLQPHLTAIAEEAFSFPAPCVDLPGPDQAAILELFHGPTAAFKDFGARFLAAALERIPGPRPVTILVATSGDTGGAVAAAFHRRAFAEVVVLFPRGRVSPRQEQQLTCWGDNVQAFSVEGEFDDCQRLVKQAFADPALSAARALSSANSINVGRLLPQAVYHAHAARTVFARTGRVPGFIVPSGNLGNGLACVWARAMGAPIGEIILAHNANRGVPELLETGHFTARPSVATLATAMDVGQPSNLERLTALYPTLDALRGGVRATSIDDDAIRRRIPAELRRTGLTLCPHSATAAEAYAQLTPAERQNHPWVWVATAHPAKFPETVEPLIGKPIPLPPALAELLDRPTRQTSIAPSLEALRAALLPQ